MSSDITKSFIQRQEVIEQAAEIIRDGSAGTPSERANKAAEMLNTLLPPPPLPQEQSYHVYPTDKNFWCIVYPATDMHHTLAKKLAGARTGQLIPLTIDELALLVDFMPWPKR